MDYIDYHTNRIVAQLVLHNRRGQETPLVIRLRGNEITYETGVSALSNHFDMLTLPRIFEGQSNQEIVGNAVAALRHEAAAVVNIATDPARPES